MYSDDIFGRIHPLLSPNRRAKSIPVLCTIIRHKQTVTNSSRFLCVHVDVSDNNPKEYEAAVYTCHQRLREEFFVDTQRGRTITGVRWNRETIEIFLLLLRREGLGEWRRDPRNSTSIELHKGRTSIRKHCLGEVSDTVEASHLSTVISY